MLYDDISSLVVLIEKLAFLNKQLYGVYCIFKSHKKPWLHSISRKHIIGKTTEESN